MTVMGDTSLVIVDYLDVRGSGAGPGEANSPLLVDPDAVLSNSIAAESFKSVSWRHPEVVERFGCVQHHQLPQRHPFDAWVDALDSLS